VSVPVVGVRATRSSPVALIESDGRGLELGDVVLAEIEGVPGLAVVALTSDQILVYPEGAVRGHQLAGPGSEEVIEAARARDGEALAVIRAELGSDAVVRSASWSSDRGRMTIVLDEAAIDLEGLVTRLEVAMRAEIRVIGSRGTTSPG
jgi:hypothetical protein